MIFGQHALSALANLGVNPPLRQGIVIHEFSSVNFSLLDWHVIAGHVYIIWVKYTFGALAILQIFKYM